jgi:dihydroorotase
VGRQTNYRLFNETVEQFQRSLAPMVTTLLYLTRKLTLRVVRFSLFPFSVVVIEMYPAGAAVERRETVKRGNSLYSNVQISSRNGEKY